MALAYSTADFSRRSASLSLAVSLFMRFLVLSWTLSNSSEVGAFSSEAVLSVVSSVFSSSTAGAASSEATLASVPSSFISTVASSSLSPTLN